MVPPDQVQVARDLQGRRVLTAYAPVEPLGWLVFVELPVDEAYAPLYAAVERSGALLGAALIFAFLAGMLLARRMVGPIRALRAGAARIGAGDLSQRISIKTGDELEALADQFNDMAGRLQESYADLENKVEIRTQELTESLQQQTATADVLKVISRSTFELQPVLDTLVESASRLCEANTAMIFLHHPDGLYHVAANHGFTRELEIFLEAHPIAPGRERLVGRTAVEGGVVHVPDVLVDPEYTFHEAQQIGGYRTMLGVPLLRQGSVVGVMALARSRVQPFTAKQIELVTTFADQAVIAIENVRLFDEVQARTRDLAESLEQQTATSEVLRVISSSPTELQPVLDALVKTASILCGADNVSILHLEGNGLPIVAHYGSLPAPAGYVVPAVRGTVSGRCVLERRAVHVADLQAETEAYPEGSVVARELGHRTVLAVPLLREGVPLGAINLRRDKVEPFTDKQIELVTTFADQAVIAIENVRLFDEVQTRTEELARSVEELRALGEVSQAVNSTLDLETVLSTIAAKAVQLSATDGGAIYVFDQQRQEFELRATHGTDEAMIAAIREQGIRTDERIIARATAQRAPVQIPDLGKEPSSPIVNIVIRAGYRAVLVVPLLRPGETVGTLVVRRKQPGEFPDRKS